MPKWGDLTGAIKSVVDAILVQVNLIPASPAAVGSAMTLNTAEHNRLLATHTSTSFLTSGTIFTIAGHVQILSIIGKITTAIPGTAQTVKLSTVIDSLASVDIATALTITSFAQYSVIYTDGTIGDAMLGTTGVAIVPAQAAAFDIDAAVSAVITATFGTSGSLGGTIVWECLWVPLDASGSVTG